MRIFFQDSISSGDSRGSSLAQPINKYGIADFGYEPISQEGRKNLRSALPK